MQGRAHTDMWTANHKLASRFFGLAVDQEVSYLLGNGVTFAEKETPNKLCPDFDQEVMDAARAAKIAGVSFGFWDLTHLRVFSLLEFVPLYDEEDGAMKAGIRFWQVAQDKPMRATLYEIDGFTEYFQPSGEDMAVMQPKRSYKLIERKAEVGETEIYDGGNYPSFPIVPLKNNKRCLSEIVGKRNTIDALDLASSNMVNNVDEGNLIYWVLSNCNGMDDLDDAKFVERLKPRTLPTPTAMMAQRWRVKPSRHPMRAPVAPLICSRKSYTRIFSALTRRRYLPGTRRRPRSRPAMCRWI